MMKETLPIATSMWDQVWKCSQCGKKFRAAPAFGSKYPRPVMNALRTRFQSHTCAADSNALNGSAAPEGKR